MLLQKAVLKRRVANTMAVESTVVELRAIICD